MKKILKDFCENIGIEYVGIAGIGPYYDLEEMLKVRIDNGHYTGFEESDIKKRIDPKLTMENVKSIIVCIFPYFIGNIDNANLSKYTYSNDYHIVVKDKLQEIGGFLKEQINDFEYKCFADNGPLVDRYLANIAGLGYFGINNNIINDKYGSYVFIGYILTNYHFEEDKKLEKSCIKCMECVKNCPGNSILGEFNMNPKKCVSFITQEKGDLSIEEIDVLNKNKTIFGCDICQDVCPHNKKIEFTNIEEFKSDIVHNLEYDEILNMSNKEFKRKYGNKSFSWRGKNIIIRNLKYLKHK